MGSLQGGVSVTQKSASWGHVTHAGSAAQRGRAPTLSSSQDSDEGAHIAEAAAAGSPARPGPLARGSAAAAPTGRAAAAAAAPPGPPSVSWRASRALMSPPPFQPAAAARGPDGRHVGRGRGFTTLTSGRGCRRQADARVSSTPGHASRRGGLWRRAEGHMRSALLLRSGTCGHKAAGGRGPRGRRRRQREGRPARSAAGRRIRFAHLAEEQVMVAHASRRRWCQPSVCAARDGRRCGKTSRGQGCRCRCARL